MILPKDKFINTPVLSLQVGGRLGVVSDLLIDPRNLSVAALVVSGSNLPQNPSYLMTMDIREMGPLGIIVDSIDVLFTAEDVIRIKEIVDFGFKMNNIKVINEDKKHIGNVFDFNLDSVDQKIQQIMVKTPLFKRLSVPELLIHRSQIIDISNEAITIKNETEKVVENSPQQAIPQPGNYTNPFRSGI